MKIPEEMYHDLNEISKKKVILQLLICSEEL